MNFYSTRLLCLFTILFFALNNSLLYSQMPPHPDLLKKINDGSMARPYALLNFDVNRERGIDAPWSEPELRKEKSSDNWTRSYGSALSPTGNYRALVILVKFSDKPSQVTATSFDNLIYSQTTGTLWDYYKKISYGTLDIVTVNLPSSTNWLTAPQTYSYYVNGNNGFGTYPQNAQKLAEDAVLLANPFVNYSNYDNNADGYVDALFIVHAGPGAEYTGSVNDIWSHAWSLYTTYNLDGVNISRYSMEPEYWQTPGDMTIGVYAHEMGHAAFGLPDLYDTDNSSEGLGNWSVMAGGSWGGGLGNSPAYPDAWSHAQMGFLTPTIITANVNSFAVLNSENNASGYILYPHGTAGKEYFLVENRQKTNFDNSLPNSGLCVYHVDENVTTVNTKEWYPGYTSNGHYMVALEQADGLWELEKLINRGNTGDVFPGSTFKTSFNNSTTPNSKDYNSASTGVAVNNISVSGSTIYVNFETISLPTVTTTTATSITNTTASSGGNVTSDGGASVTARGVCWSTSSNPTTTNNYTTDGSGTGIFISSMIGLNASTLYHYRAYATNSAGTSYGNDLTFTTATTNEALTLTALIEAIWAKG